jgi:hypothetical protein
MPTGLALEGARISGVGSLEGEQPNLAIVRVHRLREVMLVVNHSVDPANRCRTPARR